MGLCHYRISYTKPNGVKVVPILIAEANESECCVPDPILAGGARQIWRENEIGACYIYFYLLVLPSFQNVLHEQLLSKVFFLS